MTEAISINAGYYTPLMEEFNKQEQVLGYLNREEDFEKLFKSHFKALHAYAFSFVKDRDIAEDMVQAMFCKLWEKFDEIQIHRSVNGYLYRSVYYECLNYLKHQKVKGAHARYAQNLGEPHTETSSEQLQFRELEDKIGQTLRELPEGCRTIFQMSRFESLKYQQIADRLGISIKTVENQMGKALRILRLKLAEFLPLLLIGLFFKY